MYMKIITVLNLEVTNGAQCFADDADSLLSLVFDEVFEDPTPFVEDDTHSHRRYPSMRDTQGRSCCPPCFPLHSSGGRNPTHCPTRSGNALVYTEHNTRRDDHHDILWQVAPADKAVIGQIPVWGGYITNPVEKCLYCVYTGMLL